MKAIDFERIPDDRNEPTKPYTFCICGGGALGHVLAGVIGAQGYDVRMLTGHPDAWQSEITVEDLAGSRCTDGCTRSPTVRNAPPQVRPTSCFVVRAGPSDTPRTAADRPCLKPGTRVGSIVSSTGFFIAGEAHLRDGLSAFRVFSACRSSPASENTAAARSCSDTKAASTWLSRMHARRRNAFRCSKASCAHPYRRCTTSSKPCSPTATRSCIRHVSTASFRSGGPA